MAETLVSPGWEIAQDLSQSSPIISLPALAPITECLKVICPSGGRLLIASMTARVIDAGSDQINFSCLRNGMSIAPGFTAISGTIFDFTSAFAINQDVGPGEIVIYASNAAGGIIRVNVTLQCFLLRRKVDEKSTMHPRYTYPERY